MSTNRFLTTNQDRVLATEKTLTDIDDYLKSGDLEVNVTGGITVDDVKITDFDFTGGGQTSVVAITNDEEVKNGDTVDGTSQGGLLYGSNAGTAIVLGSTPVPLNPSLGALAVDIVNDSIGRLNTNLEQINSNSVATGNGQAAPVGGDSVIRVCIANDNDAINIKTDGTPIIVNEDDNVTEGDNVAGPGNAFGPLLFAEDESGFARTLKVNSLIDNALGVEIINPVTGGSLQCDIGIIGGNTMDLGNGIADTATQRVAIASDNSPVPVIESTNVDYLRAMQGVNDFNVSGMRTITFRGYKKDIGDNTINWSDVVDGLPVTGQLTLPPLSGVATFDVVSSSVNDSLAGAGAEVIVITHQDIDGNLFNTPVFMTGTTPVNVVVPGGASTCVRFVSAQVTQTGVLNQNQGTIDIYVTASPGGFNDYLCIPPGANITAHCQVYIPRNLTFYGRTINIQLSTLANDDCEFRALIKAADTNIWKTVNEQLMNGNSDENYTWDLRGFQITNAMLGGSGVDGIDLKLQGIKISNGGRLSVSASLFGYAF